MHSTDRAAAWLVLASLLAACGDAPPPPRAHPDASTLETVTVARVTAPRERVWDGVVEAVDQATLSAQTAGRIVELPYDVNDYVPAGAVVVRFTDVEQRSAVGRAQAALDAAQAAATEADADQRRIAELFREGIVPRAQLDQAVARRDATAAQLGAARAALDEAREQLEYTVVRAPYAGIVTERHVEVGGSVRAGQPLISGLSLQRLRVDVEIPQTDIGAVREHGRAALLLDGGVRVPAREVVVFPYASPDTHTFRVRVELPEAETGLYPGMTVKVAFAIGEASRVLVPARALVHRGELTGVYVVHDGRAALRQVRVGTRFGDDVEVIAGLDDGDRVVLDPAAAVRLLAAE